MPSHNEYTSISSFEKGNIDFVTVWCYVRTANIPQRDINNLCWYGNTGYRQRVSAILFEGNICGLSTYGLRITYLIKHCALVRNFQFVCMLGYQSWRPYTLILTCVGLSTISSFNPLNPDLNPICYLLALLGAHHFLHVSRIRVKLLTFRLLMSYIYIYIWSTHS